MNSCYESRTPGGFYPHELTIWHAISHPFDRYIDNIIENTCMECQQSGVYDRQALHEQPPEFILMEYVRSEAVFQVPWTTLYGLIC